MIKAPLPPDENERLKTLKDYEILDTLQEEHFDEITMTAALVFDCKISFISLIDSDRQWFKSSYGVEISETPRDISFCGHAIMGDELLIVEDASKDIRFADNPICMGAPFIKFYVGAPLIAPNGQRIGTICVLDSVTKIITEEKKSVLKQLSKQLVSYLELRKLSNQLTSRENKLTQWFVQSQDAIMTLEPPHWFFTSGNPATLKLFKVNTEADFLKMGPWAVSPERQSNGEASSEKAKRMIETALDTGAHFFEWSHMDADGRVIPCTVLLSRIKEGEKVYVKAVVRDISKQKDLEMKLTESNQFLELALDGTGLGIWDWNLKDDSVMFDKRWAGMLGYDLDQIEMNLAFWLSRIHPEDINRRNAAIRAYTDGQTDRYETTYRLKHRLGPWIHIIDRGRFSDWEEKGNPIRFTGTHLDITQKIVAEEALAKQKTIAQHHAKLASIGQLAAGVGHEINNPLAIIAGYLSAIELKYEKEEEAAPEFLSVYLKKINFAVERIAKIVKGLRSFSRMDDHDISDFSPYEAIQESIYLIDEIYKKDGINISLDSRVSEAKMISGNRGNFQQMLMNLLSNAKDAVLKSQQKNIEIILNETNNILEITIKDSGCGIAQELHEKVFEMFFTTKDVNKGTGIGLSQVHNFVKEMDGFVNIESSASNGTSFLIKLPIQKAKKKAS